MPGLYWDCRRGRAGGKAGASCSAVLSPGCSLDTEQEAEPGPASGETSPDNLATNSSAMPEAAASQDCSNLASLTSSFKVGMGIGEGCTSEV